MSEFTLIRENAANNPVRCVCQETVLSFRWHGVFVPCVPCWAAFSCSSKLSVTRSGFCSVGRQTFPYPIREGCQSSRLQSVG